MNYTLHQLAVFSKVVNTGSITRASEELFMTQPAVSIQLKNFQDQFDVPLIVNVGRSIKITEFGYEIHKIAERIISEISEINNKTQSFKGLLSGTLRLSVVSTGKYIMPFLISDFIKKHKEIDLIMDVTNKSSVVKHLIQGDIDFALISVLPDKLDLNEEVIIDNELYFVVSSEVKLEKKLYKNDDLENFQLIYREDGSATRAVMESYFEKKKITARKRIELTSNEAVKQAVLAGLGISIMPKIGIRNEIKNKKLKIIPCSGLPIKTKWRLVWLKGKQLSPVGKAYLGFLQQNRDNLILKYFKD